jgi:hypothetical protein
MCPDLDSDTDPILASVELFLRATGMTSSAFGMAAVGDPVRATRARIRAFIAAALAD